MSADRNVVEFRRTSWAAIGAGTAVVWAVLVALHPPFFTDVAASGQTGIWLTLHYAQLVLAPIVAILLLVLLRELESVPASLARGAIICWVAWFSAFDSIAGVASGVLVDVGASDAALRLFEHRIVGGAGSVLGWAGQGIWLFVAIPAGMALRQAGTPRATYVAMFASSLVVFHAGPAVAGYLALAVVFWTVRPTPAGVEAGTPVAVAADPAT